MLQVANMFEFPNRSFLGAMWQWCLCRHNHMTFPMTLKCGTADPHAGRDGCRTYMVCLDCGKDFTVRLEELLPPAVVRNPTVTHIPGDIRQPSRPHTSPALDALRRASAYLFGSGFRSGA